MSNNNQFSEVESDLRSNPDMELSMEESSLDNYFEELMKKNKHLKEKIVAERAKRNQDVSTTYKLRTPKG